MMGNGLFAMQRRYIKGLARGRKSRADSRVQKEAMSRNLQVEGNKICQAYDGWSAGAVN
jgi:hypothetical protein